MVTDEESLKTLIDLFGEEAGLSPLFIRWAPSHMTAVLSFMKLVNEIHDRDECVSAITVTEECGGLVFALDLAKLYAMRYPSRWHEVFLDHTFGSPTQYDKFWDTIFDLQYKLDIFYD